MATNKTIRVEQMSDSSILVTMAIKAAHEDKTWNKVAELYGLAQKEIADQIIEEELGEEYLLDVEICREMLLSEQKYNDEKANKEATDKYHSVFELLGVLES